MADRAKSSLGRPLVFRHPWGMPNPDPACPATPPTTPARREDDILGGILFAVLAFGLFSLVDTTVKLLTTQGYAVTQILALNGTVALAVVLSVASLRGGVRVHIRTRRPWMHTLRACLGVATGFCSFTAYSRLPLVDAYALGFTAPLWITALSVPILGEKVGWRRWSAILVGFMGVLVVLQPGAGVVDVGALAALGAAAFYSLGVLIVRLMRHTETPLSFACFSSIAAILVGGATLPWVWQSPTPAHFLLSVLGGSVSVGAMLCLLAAFRRAPAAVVAPYQYSQLLWGLLVGWVLFGTLPGPSVVVGGSIVVASGLYILYRETRVGRPPTAPLVPLVTAGPEKDVRSAP